jgi:flagellar biosynthetic protein FliP
MINRTILLKLIPIIICLLPQGLAAETFSLDLAGDAGSVTSRVIQMVGLVTVLSLAPSILMMVTSFTRIIIVLSFLRNALGLQQSPPNSVLISLALFMTAFIMTPTFEVAYKEGISPLIQEKISEDKALPLIIKPFHQFMLKHTREKDIELFMSLAKTQEVKTADDLPLQILTPAFMISELRRAFEIGFLIFIPFLIIDILVSSILMAMGMMMLPPVMIAMPFKLIFFVIIDGWYMICGSLVKSYGV